MSEYHILRGEEVFLVDHMTWARWMEGGGRESRILAKTYVAPPEMTDAVRETLGIDKPSCRVSTVFLGLDHAYGNGPPLLFETLVFGGPLDQEMMRYSTLAEARAGHDKMVRRVKNAYERPGEETGV